MAHNALNLSTGDTGGPVAPSTPGATSTPAPLSPSTPRPATRRSRPLDGRGFRSRQMCKLLALVVQVSACQPRNRGLNGNSRQP